MHALLSALKRFVDEEACPVNDGCVAGFVSGAHTGWGWARNRIGELVKKHKPHIPATAVCVFRDGEQWCCVSQDFVDLATSPAGFGTTIDEALLNLSVSA